MAYLPEDQYKDFIDPTRQAKSFSREQAEKKRKFNEAHQAAKSAMNLPEAINPSFSGNQKAGSSQTQEQEGSGTQDKSARRRTFKKRVKEGMQNVSKEKEALDATLEIEQKLKRLRNLYRIVNAGAALSIVGILVTVMVMNAQLWFANVSSVAKFMKLPLPKLNWAEIILVILIDLALLLIMVLLAATIFFIITLWEKFKVIITFGIYTPS